MGGSQVGPDQHRDVLGVALLVGAAAMVLRRCSTAAAGRNARASSTTSRRIPARTILIGVIGGLVVGLTSVGAGSLMIIMLLFLYPMIGANQLVGTDLTQAVPLTLAAALGAIAFGHVEFGVTVSLILGSVPAVLIGSLFSSTAPDRYVRPVITFVITASGLKYVGLDTETLGWTLCAILRDRRLVAWTQAPLGTGAWAQTTVGSPASGGHAADGRIGRWARCDGRHGRHAAARTSSDPSASEPCAGSLTRTGEPAFAALL